MPARAPGGNGGRMAGIGDARGKLLLFGEHAAVYGHVAVGVSLPERTTVRLGGPGSTAWGLGEIPAEDRGPVAEVLKRIESALPALLSRDRCAVRIESQVARGVGFGSSAALCAAFARALVRHLGEDPDAGGLDRVWSLAHDAEHLFHGKPSGVDTGISILGGTCILRPRPPRLPEFQLIPRPTTWIVAGAVRREEACAALIAALGQRVKAGDRTARTSIEELGRISGEAAALLRSSGTETAKTLGSLADAAMGTLRELGLSTPELEMMLDAARRAGALGGKLSGAGGGGAFYAVAADRESAEAVAARVGSDARAAGIGLIGGVRLLEA
jgi:mevalonate kinase